MIMWIVIAAVMFSHILVFTGLSQELINSVLSLSGNKYVIIGLINLVLLLMGCLVDPSTMVLIGTPIFLPIIEALGFDPVWFGVIFVLNMEMGYITPPFGMNLFIMKSVAPHISMGEVIEGVAPFLFGLAVTIGLVVAFPSLALFLPSHMR